MTGICLTIMAVLGGSVVGQAPASGTSPAVPKAGIQAAATEPAYSKTRRVPEDLLNGSRRKVIIMPREPGEVDETGQPIEDIGDRSGGVVAKIASEQHRLPEGYVIGSRVAQVDRDGKWFIAHLTPKEGMPDAPPLRILPNRELAMIEAVLADVPDSQTFLLTGRITEFQGVNYLLLEHVSQMLPPVQQQKSVQAEPATQAGTDENKPSTSGHEPTPEEIIGQLMKNQPERALVLPPGKTAGKTASAPGGEQSEAADQSQAGGPEGTFLVDRTGRVVPGGDEGWWLLAWEDRGESVQRKPVRLLPNRLLETAVALSGGGTRGVVFIVSGEIMEYKGMNYLLMRKVLVRRDLGNLR